LAAGGVIDVIGPDSVVVGDERVGAALARAVADAQRCIDAGPAVPLRHKRVCPASHGACFDPGDIGGRVHPQRRTLSHIACSIRRRRCRGSVGDWHVCA